MRLPILHITGTVSDARGNPAPGAYVDDGGRTSVTDADGRFFIQELQYGTYTIGVSRGGEAANAKSVTLSVLEPNADVDFTLGYVGRLDPYLQYANPANGAVVAPVTLRSYAKHTGVPGQPNKDCARFTGLDGTFHWMIRESTDSPEVVWRGDVEIPATQPDGRYTVSAQMVDCASSLILNLNPFAILVVVDAKPPEILSFSPVVSPAGELIIDLRDPTAGVSPSTVELLIDGEPAAAPTFTYHEQTLRARFPVAGLPAGEHTATVRARDRAGNEVAEIFAIAVDDQGPTFANQRPIGSTSSSPGISVILSDNLAGVDGASVAMTISNGVMTEAVPATFDAESGRVRYRVPDHIQEARLGRFPLPPGPYTVRVTVADLVGNTSETLWEFNVEVWLIDESP